MEYIVEYRAVLSETKEGNILVEVPDLKIFCYGSSMEDAMNETERCIIKECIERLIITQPLLMVTTKKEDLDSYILKNFDKTMIIPMFVKFNYTRPTEVADIKEKADSLGKSLKRLGSKLKKVYQIKKDTRKLKKEIHKESKENLKEMKQIFGEWHGIIDEEIKGSKGRVDEIMEGLKNLEDTDEEE